MQQIIGNDESGRSIGREEKRKKEKKKNMFVNNIMRFSKIALD